MKQVVGLYIKFLTYGQKHHRIVGTLFGLYGQWVEHGFVHIYGNITLSQWTKLEFSTSANGLPDPQINTPKVATDDSTEQQLSTSQTVVPAVVFDTVKCPSWSGYSVFRLFVPVHKVGSIIGRKGELIKKMCEETQARIRVLDGPIGAPDRVVLIHGKEDPDAPLSSPMLVVMNVFRRFSG